MGTYPCGMAFDGYSIWGANNGSNSVTKSRASDETVLGTYDVGWTPQLLAFDGTNIWVSNSGSGTVIKLRASDGIILGNYAVGSNPGGV